jgi:hypothetical protein
MTIDREYISSCLREMCDHLPPGSEDFMPWLIAAAEEIDNLRAENEELRREMESLRAAVQRYFDIAEALKAMRH